jgi:hypothetical protein
MSRAARCHWKSTGNDWAAQRLVPQESSSGVVFDIPEPEQSTKFQAEPAAAAARSLAHKRFFNNSTKARNVSMFERRGEGG